MYLYISVCIIYSICCLFCRISRRPCTLMSWLFNLITMAYHIFMYFVLFIFQDPTQSLESDELVVIYNRVPKTGSTSFANIAYDLCTRNRFNVLHLNVTKNYHVFSVSDQVRVVLHLYVSNNVVTIHNHILRLT